jgi:hypothetical protein
MYETWLRNADPGLPRWCAYTLACLLALPLMAFAGLLEVLQGGLGSVPELLESCLENLHWLWRQRTTLGSDPWRQA